MWRSNYYHEDWERRKTYLIRSLFQDIPLLSPVPEDQESRYGAGSPSDVPPSRPYSPLPPLIIERMPNKHDHSNKFYQDLETKVKKVYKKLFFDEGNSSVEDLIVRYAGNIVASSFSDEYNEEHCVENNGALNASVSTVKLYENRSQGQSSFEQVYPEQKRSDENVYRSCSDTSCSNPLSNADRSTSLQSIDVQSSTQSLCQTQIVTIVEVHKEPSNHEGTIESLHDDDRRSPVLEYHQIAYNKTIQRIETCREEQLDEKQENCSFDNICRTETSGSPNEEDSKDGEREESDEIWFSETSHKSIEVMRRQKLISPSLGSLQDEAMAPHCSRGSSTCTNVELQKNISLDLPEENLSSDDEQSSREATISRASIDFQNILTTSTPKLMKRSKTKSSTESSGTCKRVRTESCDSHSNSIMITKRRKYKNIAIQTSYISESEVDDSSGWNQHKNNFFIGSPKIFKLCSCADHDCRNN